MRFLADESCDVAVVRALREAGHDVTSVRDTMRGAPDRCARSRVARRVIDFVAVRGAELERSFVVIEPSRARVRRLAR